MKQASELTIKEMNQFLSENLFGGTAEIVDYTLSPNWAMVIEKMHERWITTQIHSVKSETFEVTMHHMFGCHLGHVACDNTIGKAVCRATIKYLQKRCEK